MSTLLRTACVHVVQVDEDLDGQSVSLDMPDLDDDEEDMHKMARPSFAPILDPAQAETQVELPSPPGPSTCASPAADDDADLDAKIARIEQLR